MLSTAKQELAKFIRYYGIEHGKFTLASGQETDTYVNIKKVASHPKGLRLIADAIIEEIGEELENIDAIGGMETGAIYISTAVSLSCSFRNPVSNPLKTFSVRKNVKDHGTQKRIEGDIPENGYIVIVEDVITTGKSIIDVISVINNEYKNCEIVKVISVVDRSLPHIVLQDDLKTWGIPYCSLLTLKDLENSKVSESEKKFTDYCINDLSSKLDIMKNEISNVIEYVRDWIRKQNSPEISKCYIALEDLFIVVYVLPTGRTWDPDLSDLLTKLDIEMARVFKSSFEIREWPDKEIAPSDNKLEILVKDSVQNELEKAADRLDQEYKTY